MQGWGSCELGSIPSTPTKSKNRSQMRFFDGSTPLGILSEKTLSGNHSPHPRARNHIRIPLRTFVPDLTRKSRAYLIISLSQKSCQIILSKDLKHLLFALSKKQLLAQPINYKLLSLRRLRLAKVSLLLLLFSLSLTIDNYIQE